MAGRATGGEGGLVSGSGASFRERFGFPKAVLETGQRRPSQRIPPSSTVAARRSEPSRRR